MSNSTILEEEVVVFPASFAQQRLWFLDQLQPGDSAYNVPAAVRLTGVLDASALARGLAALVARHETLRTTFMLIDGQPQQLIGAPLPQAGTGTAPLLPLLDLCALPAVGRTAMVQWLASVEAQRPFDLARGPLLRVTLLRLDSAEHVVLVNMHHIISDAWSVGIFIRELATLYRADVTGRHAALPELPIQYADYALWQRQWLQDAEGATQPSPLQALLAYWKQHLAGTTGRVDATGHGEPPILALPTDHPRPAIQTAHGARYDFVLSPTLHLQLAALSRRAGATLFMTALAAWLAQLARYADQDDIVIGTPIVNRTRVELEGLIGFFANALVLRTNLAGNPTFHEALRRAREVCLGVYAHQELPFDLLVEALQPARDLSAHPLFQVTFSLQKMSPTALDLPGLTLSPLAFDNPLTKFDLTLSLMETADRLIGSLEYRTDLFEAPTIARMAGHFQTLLAGIVAQPDRRLADLPLLTAAERAQLLREWNDTAAGVRRRESDAKRRPSASELLTSYSWLLDAESCFIHQLFDAQAELTPDRVALVYDQTMNDDLRDLPPGFQQVTYTVLYRRANQLAQYLLGLGVGPEARVAICMVRSPELVVALLGVLKAGAAYVPLDPGYPTERLAFMLEDSRATVLITQKSIYDLRFTIYDLEQSPSAIVNPKSKIVNLDADWPIIARQPDRTPDSRLTAAHLAYMIYTSGTTGRPKAVLVEHGSLLNTMFASQARYRFTGVDSIAYVLSFAFDIALFEIMSPLLVGGQTILVTEQQVLDLPEFARIMERITFLHGPPSLLRQIVNFVQETGTQARYGNIRQIAVGGDSVPLDLLRDLQRVFASAQVYEGYGPTEGTIMCTNYAVPRDETRPKQLIGKPMRNMIVRLYDRYQNLVPIGVPGELYIGGAGVVRGYHNRPGLTAERFVPDAFADFGLPILDFGLGATDDPIQNRVPRRGESKIQNGTRLYKTGDLARYRSDGNIEFIGRGDQQVKLRGFRIELGEIETVLRSHPHVRAAVALIRADHADEPRLVAYVVQRSEGRDQGSVDPASETLIPDPRSLIPALRSFLATRLPAYMVPAAFVLLDALPLTMNGKVDRAALPVPDRVRPALASTYVAPRTPVEATLARIWAAVLRRDEIGAEDNFFDLGGDSILSIQIVARARAAGLAITPKDLFQHQTIATLANVAGAAPVVAAPQELVVGPVPLTPIQRHFFERALPDPQHFNQAVPLTVLQPLDRARLGQALQHLLVQHDALRLRFTHDGDGWQACHALHTARPPLHALDLSALPAAVQATTLTVVAGALHASLDLTRGPLLRVAVFDHGAGQSAQVLLIVHHLVIDGVSWRILLDDLHRAYRQLAQGQAVALPPKTTSFQQWATRLQDYAQSEALRQQLAYWLAPDWPTASPLPRDHPDGTNTVGAAQQVQAALDAEATTALLHEVPAVYHTQIDEVLLTALALVWARWTGARTLVVDLEGHGREELDAALDLTRTVGWFTTLYPLRLALPNDPDLGTALKAIKEQVRAVPQRGLAYGLGRYLRNEPALAAQAPAPLSFNYLGQLDQALPEGGLFGPSRADSGPSQSRDGARAHLLELNGLIAGGRLRLEWSYSAQVHARETITRLAEAYLDALRALIAHCRAPDAGGFTPSDFPLARLDQPTLDRVIGTERAIDALYPLTPMQQGMLFHTLYAPRSGMYVEQMSCTLQGELDVAAFERAWQQVADRHPVFRTAFVWTGLDEPLQLVRRQVALPWRREDWRAQSPDQQAAQLDALLEADRDQGFDLAVAPLVRLALFRLAADAYAFVWSQHHMLMDGWSLPPVLNEVFVCYTACVQGQTATLPQPRPYRDYIAWLQRQDLAQAEAFWCRALAGFSRPTPLGGDQPASRVAEPERYAEQQLKVAAETTATIQAVARRQGLTLNTVVQGAWALLLSHLSGEPDVVFGTTVAGRPPDLPGVESMIGLFINTLPMRAHVLPDARLCDWLQQLQQAQVELRQHECSSLAQIHRWSAVPHDQPLFESIMIFENYPVVTVAQAQGERPRLAIQNVRMAVRTNYPLTLAVAPGEQLLIHLEHDCRRFSAALISRMLSLFDLLLQTISRTQLDARLGTLAELLATEERRQRTSRAKELETANLQQLKQIKRRSVQPLPQREDG